MAAICRLIGRRQLLNLSNATEQAMFTVLRPITIKAKPYQEPEKMTLHERAVKLQRPQSPHLTIYAPQLTSMMSITHRFTGATLSIYAASFSIAALVLDPGTIPQFIEDIHNHEGGEIGVLICKPILAFPIAYHMSNGIRHLNWDIGNSLSIHGVYITGYVVILLAIALTAFATFTPYPLEGLEFNKDKTAEELEKGKQGVKGKESKK